MERAGEGRESHSALIDKLDSVNKYLTRQVQIMTGDVEKKRQQIKALDNVNMHIVKYENTLFIGSLKETIDEDCHHTVQKKLHDTLGMIKLDDGIHKAWKMAVVRKSLPLRLMLIKCSIHQRIMIIKNFKSLKGKNTDSFNIYVTRLQPKAISKRAKTQLRTDPRDYRKQ